MTSQISLRLPWQALQLLTVDKIEVVQKAALTWLEDNFLPENHWAIAAGQATVLLV